MYALSMSVVNKEATYLLIVRQSQASRRKIKISISSNRSMKL